MSRVSDVHNFRLACAAARRGSNSDDGVMMRR